MKDEHIRNLTEKTGGERLRTHTQKNIGRQDAAQKTEGGREKTV